MHGRTKHKNVKFARIFNTLIKNQIFFVMSKSGRGVTLQMLGLRMKNREFKSRLHNFFCLL